MTAQEDVSGIRRHEAVWGDIEREKQRDRLIRRATIVAWSVTGVVLIILAVFIGINVAHVARLAKVGIVAPGSVLDAVMPLVIVVGTVSLLVAVLTTIGVFLRLRTSSLAEIQYRLASLESAILDRHREEQ